MAISETKTLFEIFLHLTCVVAVFVITVFAVVLRVEKCHKVRLAQPRLTTVLLIE